MTRTQSSNGSLHLPRILCLHGGGVNGRIFRLQCRVLIAQLQTTFRLCFMDAPYTSGPGPGMVPTYEHHGPFRRWLRWHPDHPRVNAETAEQAIQQQLADAMRHDDESGATGEWVGLLGFSQGAKVAASVMLMQEHDPFCLTGWTFRFAILLAGSAPLVTLDSALLTSPYLADASQNTVKTHGTYDQVYRNQITVSSTDHTIRSPTVHVHGLRDPGIYRHRALLEQYCDPKVTRLVEWDGDHRVPIKKNDVDAVVSAIKDVARDCGVIR